MFSFILSYTNCGANYHELMKSRFRNLALRGLETPATIHDFAKRNWYYFTLHYYMYMRIDHSANELSGVAKGKISAWPFLF